MSTYNGEQYLREQLESILSQTYKNIEVLIRDDGSTDSTLKILKEYSGLYNNISFYQGKNFKPAKSFLDLLRKVSCADFYAFCDQDDVWQNHKIEVAVTKLIESQSELYYSAYSTVDKYGNIIQENVNNHSHDDTLGNSFVDLAVTGCTMVFTRKLLEIITKSKPNEIMMHDSWIYKTALCMGFKVIYDKNAYIYYRQHDHNVIGANKDQWNKWKGRFHRWFKRNENRRYKEIYELFNSYVSIMPKESLNIIEPMIGYKEKNFMRRFQIATQKVYRTGNWKLDIPFIMSVVAKRY